MTDLPIINRAGLINLYKWFKAEEDFVKQPGANELAIVWAIIINHGSNKLLVQACREFVAAVDYEGRPPECCWGVEYNELKQSLIQMP